MINITSTVPLPVQRKYIKQLGQAVLKVVHRHAYEASILFCDNRGIRTYNRKFLGRDRATDVIAFVDDKRLPAYQKNYLGDMVISVDRARSQAKVLRHSIRKELSVLIIHGILHLSGYDDTTPIKKGKMFRKQEEIYNKIRNSNIEIRKKY